MPNPVRTKRKKDFFDGYRYPYVLLPWLEGETPQLNKAEEWRQLSRGMASFHLATAGFETGKCPIRGTGLGNGAIGGCKCIKKWKFSIWRPKWTAVPTELDEIWRESFPLFAGLDEKFVKIFGENGA